MLRRRVTRCVLFRLQSFGVFTAWLSVSLIGAAAQAEVRLPAIFGDHMVLQREKPLPIWGWAAPGEEVSVTLGEETKETTAGDDGVWQVTLSPQSVAREQTLTIAGSNKITLRDVSVGEVWICSGQSNMAWPVSAAWNGDLARAGGEQVDVRLISVPGPGSQTPEKDFPGAWERATPEAVAQFSAVGFYFGERLAETLNVPVGLIDNSWGGSACEAWVPRQQLARGEAFQPLMDRWTQMETELDEDAEATKYEEDLASWREDVEKAKQRGARPREQPKPRGHALGNHRPGNLFNARVAPLIPFAVRGAIWYQGESNASRAAEYRELFPLMIQSWRDAWGKGEFPFYWVQLADFQAESEAPQESDWAELREAQTMTLDRLPNTGQAVIIDLGEASDIHPRNKQEVANRLARWALAKDYGVSVVCASPRAQKVEVAGDKAIVTFDDVSRRLRTVDAKPVQGFEIAGSDNKWHAAEAKILDRQRVEVASPEVTDPTAIRYAWANNPVCNLYDDSGLPVTPFRLEADPSKADPSSE